MDKLGTARRVKQAEARKHFAQGGEVLVSDQGHREEIPVFEQTTTHTLERTTWDGLLELVRMWASRYPGQRFYIVERAA